MAAARLFSRRRTFAAPRGLKLSLGSSLSSSIRKSRLSGGVWVLIGVPVLLLAVFGWQVGSTLLHSDQVVRGAVAVARASLESDPAGSRIEFVLVDRVGQETTVNGDLSIRLREPDGAVWQATRAVTAADFVPLPAGGLLAGRVGYSVLIPSTDWLRAPRRGGAASISVAVQPTDGVAFSTTAEERFP
jgi:hypothetical protein